MGEEDRTSDCEMKILGEEEADRVQEWEVGLPSSDDLMPLSQLLIPPELASAFSISPEPCRSNLDVNRASQNTLTSLRRTNSGFPPKNLKSLPSFGDEMQLQDPSVVEAEENPTPQAAESRKTRRMDSATMEEAESGSQAGIGDNSVDDQSTRSSKRPRLVWTPQLHKRFVDVVAHLGIKNAVPKTIMQLMNVEGLTRENVASHLQKYRLYLKRMQGLSNEGPSSSDQLFASTPVPQSFHEHSGPIPIPMPYGHPFMQMPVLGMPHGSSHVPIPMNNPVAPVAPYHGFQSHPYNVFREPQRDWSGNNFGSSASYPRVTPNDK